VDRPVDQFDEFFVLEPIDDAKQPSRPLADARWRERSRPIGIGKPVGESRRDLRRRSWAVAFRPRIPFSTSSVSPGFGSGTGSRLSQRVVKLCRTWRSRPKGDGRMQSPQGDSLFSFRIPGEAIIGSNGLGAWISLLGSSYLPEKFGFLFSRNAANPSARSSVENVFSTSCRS
jgi:hypothetical protein